MALLSFNKNPFLATLSTPKVFTLNGGEAEQELFFPLLSKALIEVEKLTVWVKEQETAVPVDILFVRPKGALRSRSSVLLRRRHPSNLKRESIPS
jgi:hypothetical protein